MHCLGTVEESKYDVNVAYKLTSVTLSTCKIFRYCCSLAAACPLRMHCPETVEEPNYEIAVAYKLISVINIDF